MTTISTTKKNISKELAFFLMDERISSQLTTKEMSKKLGIKDSKLSKMESGTYEFSISEIALITDMFDVQISFSPKTSHKSNCKKNSVQH